MVHICAPLTRPVVTFTPGVVAGSVPNSETIMPKREAFPAR